eukprot:gene5885-30384_t
MLALLPLMAGVSLSEWNHGWGSTAEMTFADFNSNQVLTDQQLNFVNEKYAVISFEKCTGMGAGVKTEDAIYSEAIRLKKLDPTKKIFFYFATDQQGIDCYNAGEEYKAHPEFYLKDDHGNNYRTPFMDCSNKAAQDWWISVPLRGDGNGTYKGVPVADLIDGVLADSAGYELYSYKNISIPRIEALEDAKFAMMARLQAEFTKLNGGIVMANAAKSTKASNFAIKGGHEQLPKLITVGISGCGGDANTSNVDGAVANSCSSLESCSIGVRTSTWILDGIATPAERTGVVFISAIRHKAFSMETPPPIRIFSRRSSASP